MNSVSVLAPIRALFRALAQTVVPEASDLDEQGWTEVEAIIEGVMSRRPARQRRQLVLFLRLIDVLARLRDRRSFGALDTRRRTALLESLQDSRIALIRRGFWGVRTLSLMGYYARVEGAKEVGYRADPRGWEARA